MKKLILAICLAVATNSGMVQAASHEHDVSQHQMTTGTTVKHRGAGVLKAVNAQNGKVQIAHEPIAELGWPSMTMWFALKAPLSQDLKIGDPVRFEMIQDDKKQWVIVKIARK